MLKSIKPHFEDYIYSIQNDTSASHSWQPNIYPWEIPVFDTSSGTKTLTGRCGSSKDFWFGTFKSFLFPTCQVRVVRFYVSHPGRFLLFFFVISVGTFCFFFNFSLLAQLMVWGWWFGARWFGFRLDLENERDCSLRVPRFESQTTGTQTINLP